MRPLSFLPAISPPTELGELATATTALLVAAATVVVLVKATSGRKSKIPLGADGKPLPMLSTTLPVVGNTLDFLHNRTRMHDWVSEASIGFGGRPWLLRMLGQGSMVVLTSPEALEDVERAHFDTFGKGPFINQLLHDLLGDGIVNVDGELWAYQRKTFASMLSSRALRESMTAIIHKHSVTLDAVLDKAADAQTELDVSKLLHQFTMEAFTEFGFGLELGALGTDAAHPFETAFDDAQHCIMKRMQMPTLVWKLQRWLGVGSEGHLKKCMAMVHETVMKIIEQTIENAKARQSGGAEGTTHKKSVVSVFVESESADRKLTPELLRDIVLNTLLGGRDTSAEAITWLLYCLSQHPGAEEKIRDEITDKLGKDLDTHTVITVDDLQRLTYLEAALKETLRLYPPANFNMRYAYDDAVLSDGTFIPGGCYAVICPYAMGRRTDVWGEDAAQFNPERWLDPADPSKLRPMSNFKFNSFLGGPRMCPGMNLAMMEMKTIVVKTLRKFHLKLVPREHVTYLHSVTLPIKDGLVVTVERL